MFGSTRLGSVVGMLGVFSGLSLVIMTEPTQPSNKEEYKYDKIKGDNSADLEMT